MFNHVVGSASALDNISNLSQSGLAVLLICSIALLFVERKKTFWPIIIMVLFVSQEQKIVISSLDFNIMRIMALVGFLRVSLRGELKSMARHKLDYYIIGYALTEAFFHLVRDGSSVLGYTIGHFMDFVLPYFVFRAVIQTHEDLIESIKILAILSAAVSVFFLYQHFTGKNMLSFFGGVSIETVIRKGRLRCQGAFQHPIIAGVYFATILPLFVALFWHKNKASATTGVVAAMLIIFASSSSTPVFALASGLFGMLLFPLREFMMAIRWSVYATIISLHLVMKAPVWNLIARVSATGGSTSWYRFMLIDQTIKHFSGWWLIGSSSFSGWYITRSVDITDNYVRVALFAGLPGLILFIATIVLSFAAVGRVWRRVQHDRSKMMLAWSLGCSLFAMIMSFIGVSMWGEMLMLWPMVLAMIASMDNYSSMNEAMAKKGAVSL